MLTRPHVQRYAAESGLRDLMIAEKEVVLTFLLQLLSERGILNRLAFKGGTCLRKMFVGSQGRFSTDLDFTGLEEHDHEDVILEMMDAFEQPFHGIQFSIPDEGYYETQDGLSWGVNPAYVHEWNAAGSEIKLQISRRETPTLPPEQRAQLEQSYFQHLPFAPADIVRLALAEIIAEKIRACYQRNKARDIYDLGMFATRPLEQPLIRRLVVLKLWQPRPSEGTGSIRSSRCDRRVTAPIDHLRVLRRYAKGTPASGHQLDHRGYAEPNAFGDDGRDRRVAACVECRS